jgi:hypothetical protein
VDLARVQNETRQYQAALQTAQRVHALDHKGLANLRYIAAGAALALNDRDAMARELNVFLIEDPTNAFAPVARQNLAVLTQNKNATVAASGNPKAASDPSVQRLHTFPNSERCKAQLSSLRDESNGGASDGCDTLAETKAPVAGGSGRTTSDLPRHYSGGSAGTWTILRASMR